jgi:hypothetical protein
MDGKARPRQRAPRVFRTFVPNRLQDDLLAAVYDRLLEAGARVEGNQDEVKGAQPERASDVQRQVAETGR